MAKKVYDFKAADRGQVLFPPLQPLQDLRQAPCLSAGLRRLPYLLQRAGLQGPDPRRQKGKLVTSWQYDSSGFRSQEKMDPEAAAFDSHSSDDILIVLKRTAKRCP